METPRNNNKSSLFSAVFPSGDPVPAPAPAPPPRPQVSNEQVEALNRKIEALERNLMRELEKKLTELPAAQDPSPAIPDMLGKMTEIESRFREFQDKFLLGASQMKNIEESKITARREIEELLKAVREQQKYSEMDRQMHAQLEKAWQRVEEIEKRMVDAYTEAARRPAAPPPAPAVPPPGISEKVIVAEISGAVNARLDEKLAGFEAELKKVIAAVDASMRSAGTAEKREAGLLSPIMDVVSGLAAAVQQLRVEVFSGKERVEDVLESSKQELSAAVKAAVSEERAAAAGQMAGVSEEIRGYVDSQGKMLLAQMEELYVKQRDISVKISMLEGALKKESEKSLAGCANAAERAQKDVVERIRCLVSASGAETSAKLEELRGIFGLALGKTAALSSTEKALSGIEDRCCALVSGLRGLVKDLEPIKLEALLGVSGSIVRRDLQAFRELTDGLERELTELTQLRSELSAAKPHPARPDTEEL